MVWRFTSPALHEMGAAMLYECPVGAVLRDAPYVYDLIQAGGYAEQTGVGMLSQSRYLQHACTLVAAERARLRELEQQDRQAKSDASYGANLLRKGRR